MTKRKRTQSEPEWEQYEIEVEDWDADCFFHLREPRKQSVEGVYWEYSKLTLKGKLLSPVVKQATKASIEITADPQLDDHWAPKPSIISAKANGWMYVFKERDTLVFNCSVTTRLFYFASLAVHSGKIKFASLTGTKLKWLKGTLKSITLSTIHEEE